jgi:hypothetical protein
MLQLIETHEATPNGRMPAAIDPNARPMRSVAVVADGLPGWQRQQSDRILNELTTRLSAAGPLLVTWFGAEPVERQEFAIRDTNREVLTAKPRTAMRDAMESALAALADAPRPHVMVVIAQEEFYPSSVPASRLLELARISATRIYAIDLPAEPDQANGPHHVSRSVTHGLLSLFERAMVRERAYTASDTARLLKRMSEATGGCACAAANQDSGTACASAVAHAIEELSSPATE